MTKRFAKNALITGALLLGIAGGAAGQAEGQTRAGFNIEGNSQYLAMGNKFAKGPVMHHYGFVGRGRMRLAYFSTTDPAEGYRTVEINPRVEMDVVQRKNLSATVSVRQICAPLAKIYTQELNGSISAFAGNQRVTLDHWQDINKYHGRALRLHYMRSDKLPVIGELESGVSAHWTHKYYREGSGFAAVEPHVSKSIPLDRHTAVNVRVGYHHAPAKDLPGGFYTQVGIGVRR